MQEDVQVAYVIECSVQTSLQTVFNIHILYRPSWKTQTDH